MSNFWALSKLWPCWLRESCWASLQAGSQLTPCIKCQVLPMRCIPHAPAPLCAWPGPSTAHRTGVSLRHRLHSVLNRCWSQCTGQIQRGATCCSHSLGSLCCVQHWHSLHATCSTSIILAQHIACTAGHGLVTGSALGTWSQPGVHAACGSPLGWLCADSKSDPNWTGPKASTQSQFSMGSACCPHPRLAHRLYVWHPCFIQICLWGTSVRLPNYCL